MNTLTAAYRMLEAIDKRAFALTQSGWEYEKALQVAKDEETLKLKRALEIKETIIDPALFEASGKYYKQKYFVTIRPDETKTDLKNFVQLVNKLISRKCFISYLYSWEQKGLKEEDLGVGFHIHIIADVAQRSKGELLRDIQNTMKSCVATNCIDAKPIRNEKEYKNFLSYIQDYTSADGHKEKTKEWDLLWRKKINFEDVYDCILTPLPSSPTGRGNSPRGAVTVTF